VRLPFLRFALAGLAAALIGAPALAQDASVCDSRWLTWVKSNCEGARDAWRGEDDDVYVFGHVHHGRGTYTREKIATYNERAWGAGVGKHRLDAKDNTHLIYAIAFSDSHFKPEYMVGYGWLTYWRPLGGDLRAGLGFTALITLRSDYSSYLAPVPGLLPLGELAWKRASLMVTYIPQLSRNEGNGDVTMIFGRIAF
jgi:lipid IVA palmitoyltransferase